MDFSDALHQAKAGFKITRTGWNAPGMWATSMHPTCTADAWQPYLYLVNTVNELAPYTPSQFDLFAEDWAVVA